MSRLALIFFFTGSIFAADPPHILAANQNVDKWGMHLIFTIPAGGWIRCNPKGEIPVYLVDPHALDEVAGRTDAFIVLAGGLGIFLSSGREDLYYWQISRALQAEFPDRHDLAELCGDGCPDALIRELKAGATP